MAGAPQRSETKGGTGVKHLGLKSDLHIIWLGILGIKTEVLTAMAVQFVDVHNSKKNWNEIDFCSFTKLIKRSHTDMDKRLRKRKKQMAHKQNKQQTILKKDIFIHDHFSMYFTLKIIVIGF